MNFLVYLHHIGLSHKILQQLCKDRRDFENIFYTLNTDILGKYIKKSEKITSILEQRDTLDTKKIDDILRKYDIQIIPIFDERYPQLLKNITYPPYFLYVRGVLQGDDSYLSVVGSRSTHIYAKKSAESILPSLAKHFTIVSGGAGGCDTLAHRLTLENHGKTIAVFGTGIDVYYPKSNTKLFDEIVSSGGALISIFPLGTLGNTYTFPIRNEIVAGMSRGVLILQAGERSGTLITADLAINQGKDVFALPADIFISGFYGSNQLIKSSQAMLVQSADDILENYGFHSTTIPRQDIKFSSQQQEVIYQVLKNNLSLNFDELLQKTSLTYEEISLGVGMLELSGYVKKDMYGKYMIS